MVKDLDGPAELKPGSCIGRYRIEKELGRGGESVVYLATDLHLGKRWALKVVRKRDEERETDTDTGSGSLRRVFYEEAELMNRLDHPALPRIVDILEKNDTLILIMDYVEGETMAELLKRAGPFREEAVREWMYRLAGVLEYLHGQSPPVIYRDMKPANVIRKPDGALVLLDLGIAREYKNDRERDTAILGTRGYAPPEQYGNAQTDVRSDIYSLGMTAAELLTGIPPDRDPYLYKTHPFRKILPEISEDFERILNRCLAFSPRDRYRSCRELMLDLQRDPVEKKHSLRKERTHIFMKKKRVQSKRYPRNRYRQEPVRKKWRRREPYPGSKEKKPKKNFVAVLAGLIIVEVLAGVLIGGTKNPSVQADPVQEEKQDSLQEIRDLLQACGRAGSLSEEKGLLLQRLLTELPQESLQDRKAYAEICFSAGQTCLFSYGGEQGSFRSRILWAKPFFEDALEILQEDGDGIAGKENVPDEKRVRNYVQLCEFFALYMFDQDGISEPGEDDCQEIMDAIRTCLNELPLQETGDGAWMQLTLLQSITALIREYRQNFADTGIRRDVVLQILQDAGDRAASVSAKRVKLTELREEILQGCAECREEVSRTYENMEKWKEAEKSYDWDAEEYDREKEEEEY